MKQPLLFSFLSILSVSLSAQITITDADIGDAGDSMVVGNYSPDTSISVGGSGNQNWNFTFAVDDINTLKFEDPANTNRAALFPNADIAIERQDDTLFFAKTATEFALDGLSGDVSALTGIPLTLGLNIDGNVKQIEFPATFNSSFADQAVIDTTVDCAALGAGSFCEQARVKRRYIVSAEIDAYGSLEHSGGKYNNTLRQYTEERTIDSVWANLPFIGGPLNFIQEIDSTSHIYRWLANDEDWPVLTAFADAEGGNMIQVEFQVDTLLAYITGSTQPSCNGDCDGSATVEPIGDTGPFTFSWPASAGNQSSATGTNLCASTYMVTVSDNQSNSTTIEVVINEPAPMAVTGSIKGVTTTNDGAVDITASGGSGNYTYAWVGPDGFSATTGDISGLAEGTYTVTIVDQNGCEVTESYIVVATGIGEINRQSLTLFPNPADQEIQITSKHVIDEVILLDLIGNRVLRQPVNNAKMRLGTSDISNGIYLLQVSTNDQVLVEKITIKH